MFKSGQRASLGTALLLTALAAPPVGGNGADPLFYFTVVPCRLLDTRSTTPLSSGTPLTVQVTGNCGVTADAKAVAVSVTIVTPSATGHLNLFESGIVDPGTSVLNFNVGVTRAGNGVVSLSDTGQLDAVASLAGGGMADLILDVMGYFGDNPPTAVDDGATVTEDDAATAIDVLTNDPNDDGGPKAIASAADPAHGTVVLTGGTTGQHTGLEYTPDPNYCNNPPGTTLDTFTYTLFPGGDEGLVSVTVDCVNDAPAGTANTVTTTEDTAYAFTVADFGFTDPTDDPNDEPNHALLAVKITTLATAGTLELSSVAVVADQDIAVADITAGNLEFVAAADANGLAYATFTFQVQDDGGTGGGGVDLDPTPRTMTIDVTSVNDEPAGADNAVTTDEDVQYTFVAADFGFTDPNDTPANSLFSVTVSAPTAGSLTLSGEVSLADITAGNLKFTPAGDAFGSPYATFTFQVRDDGGTTGGGVDLDASANTMTVNVTAVNDEPTVTTTAGTTAWTEGTPATVDSGVTTGDVDDANLESATVSIFDPQDGAAEVLAAAGCGAFTLTPGLNTLAITGSQPLATYTTCLASVTYDNTSDNPNTADRRIDFVVNDGDLDSLVASKTVTLGAVDDAPTAVDDTVTVAEDSSANAIDVLGNESDPDGGPVNVDTVTSPSANGGTVVRTPAGPGPYTGVDYTPAANYCATAVTDVAYYRLGEDDAGAADGNTGNATTVDSAGSLDLGRIGAPAYDAAAPGQTTSALSIDFTSGDAYGTNAVATSAVDDFGIEAWVRASATPAAAVIAYNGDTASGTETGWGLYQTGDLFVARLGGVTQSAGRSVFTGQWIHLALVVTGGTGRFYVNGVEADSFAAAPIDPSASSGADTLIGGNLDGSESFEGEIDDMRIFTFAPGTFSVSDLHLSGPNRTSPDTFDYTLTPGGDTGRVEVTVTCSDDETVANADTATVDEDALATPINVLGNDVDPDGGHSITAVTQPTNGTAAIIGGGSAVSYTPDDDFCSATPDTFTYEVDPGDVVATVSVTVNCVNDPPVADDDGYAVDEGGTLNVSVPGVLDGDTDEETPGSLTAATDSTPANDSAFSFPGDGSFSYTHDGSETTSDSFTYHASDGTSDSNIATVTITINPVNDPPAINAAAARAYTEGDGAVAIDNALTVTDPDDATLPSATVKLEAPNYVSGEDVLGFVDNCGGGCTGVTGSFVAATGTLTLTGPAAPSVFQAALRTVTYNNTSDDPSTLARTTTWTVNDDEPSSGTDTTTINVTAVNDAPTVTTTGGTTAFTEDLGAVVVDAGVTVADVDDTNLESATVSLASAPDGGAETLAVQSPGTNCPGLAVTPGNPLTISNSATEAVYQTCLQNVTYDNTDQDPDAANRTVNFVVNDGAASSLAGAKTVSVLPVNDAPTVATTGGSTSFTEDLGAVVVDSGVTVADVDDANLNSASVTIFNVLNVGLETLNIDNAANCPGLTVTPGTTLTIANAATKAVYQTCLQHVTYNNTSQAPNITDRTINFVVNDGDADSNIAAKTVTVTAVNDAPSVTNEVFDVIGNTELRVDMTAGTTPHASDTTAGASSYEGVLDNDSDVEGDPFTVTAIGNGCSDATAPFDCTLSDGAFVHVDANGEFSYTPGPGDIAGSFTYTVTDTPAAGIAASSNGTVTFNVQEMVWYVDNSFAGTPNGTSIAPLNALSGDPTNINGAGGAGDADGPNHYIFIDFGNGAASGQNQGFTLESGQRLIGEFSGLSIPVNLNGNGSPTVLKGVPTLTACGGGPCRPLLDDTVAGGPECVSATDIVPAQISGLNLAGTNGNGFDWTTSGTFAGTSTLTFTDNVVRSATAEGVDVNLGGTGAFNVILAFSDNTVTAAGNGVDILENGGAGTLTISAFDDNVVQGATVDNGMVVNGAVFDAAGTAGIQVVSGGTTIIGQSGTGVGLAGLSLSNVTGDLAFVDLDIFSVGTALSAAGGAGFDLDVTSGAGQFVSTGGPAISLSTLDADIQNALLTSTNSISTGLALTTITGTFSASSGSTITGADTSDIDIDDTNATISHAGTITNSEARSVEITNTDGGSVTISGLVTDTGTGIFLDNNDQGAGGAGAAITFAGGMSVSTGGAAAFTATNGGTVAVCDENPCNPGAEGLLVNTLTTTTGTALNVANTTIGANNLEFRSISAGTVATGPSNGIVVNATGASGGLKVKGTGSAGSGGTIQRTSGPGILLTSTSGVSLSSMNVQNSGDDGIRGTTVNGFTLNQTTVSANGNAAGESGVDFSGLTGSAAFTSSTVTGSAENNVVIRNSSGTLSPLTVTGSTFSSNSSIGADGFLIDTTGTASVTASVTSSTFSANRDDHFQAAAANSATLDVTFTGNTLTGGHATALNQGITVNAATAVPGYTGSVDYTISGNSINGAILNAIQTNLGTSAIGATMTGTISTNLIGTNGSFQSCSTSGSGIGIDAHGNGTHTALVSGNTIRQCFDRGITVLANDGSGTLNLTVTGNNSSHSDGTNSREGFFINAGSADPNIFGVADAHFVCLDLGGAGALSNTLTHGPGAPDDFRLRQRFNTTIRLPGYGGAATDTAAVIGYVISRNSATVGSATVNSPPGGGFAGGAACPVP